MRMLKLHPLLESEIMLLKEYDLVMSRLFKALDKVYGKNEAYFETMLSIVIATVMEFKEVKSEGLAYCSSLVDALLAGIKKMLGKFLDDEDHLCAAAFIPNFGCFNRKRGPFESQAGYDFSRWEGVRTNYDRSKVAMKKAQAAKTKRTTFSVPSSSTLKPSQTCKQLQFISQDGWTPILKVYLKIEVFWMKKFWLTRS